MFSLDRFGVGDLMDCRSALRGLFVPQPATIAEAGERVVKFFRSEFVDGTGRPSCTLVRLFKTHRYDDLPEHLKAIAREISPDADDIENLRCLVLVGTAGDLEEWQSPEKSRGHRVIPLVSEQMVAQAPMISQLIRQMGVDIGAVLRPERALLDPDESAHNVFYVPDAAGSEHIPAQDFVSRHGVRSVIGFGGMVGTGDLFAVILFSNVAIPRTVAESFRVIGLNLKIAMLGVARRPLF